MYLEAMSPCVVSMCSSLQSLSILSERVFTWPTVNYVTTEDDNDNDHSIVAWRHSTEQENIKKRIWTIKVSLLSSSLLNVDRNLCVFVLLCFQSAHCNVVKRKEFLK